MPWETPIPSRGHQGNVSCFPPLRTAGLLTTSGAQNPFSAPGNCFSLLPRAPGPFSAPGNCFSLLPRAPGPFSAPGNCFSLLLGAPGPFSAPGNVFSVLPGVPRPLSAPGNDFPMLPGALGTLSAPGSLFSFSRSYRDGIVRVSNREKFGRVGRKSGWESREESRVDQVHFEVLYQVHYPWPKSPSEPHMVYLVHPLKEDLVHLGATTLLPRTLFGILPSCKRGRREPPKLPASHANRRAGLCAAVVHHHIPPSWVRRPMSPRREQLCHVLHGGGASSHPAILGKAPNVSPAGNSCAAYCAAVVHHRIPPSWVRRPMSSRREQPRVVMHGGDSPILLIYH